MSSLREEMVEHTTTVISFLVWLEHTKPDESYGGKKITDVVNSFCALTGLPSDEIRERFLLEQAKPGDDRHG